jgi:hypothetical protein
MIKRLAIALFLVLMGTAAMAQERTAAPAVLQIQSADARTHRVDVELGEVQITTHNTRYHLVYLPVLPPLPGTAFRTTREIPNALALTATQIPQRRREAAVVTIR